MYTMPDVVIRPELKLDGTYSRRHGPAEIFSVAVPFGERYYIQQHPHRRHIWFYPRNRTGKICRGDFSIICWSADRMLASTLHYNYINKGFHKNTPNWNMTPPDVRLLLAPGDTIRGYWLGDVLGPQTKCRFLVDVEGNVKHPPPERIAGEPASKESEHISCRGTAGAVVVLTALPFLLSLIV